MQGAITGRHVIRHLPLIWREFGRATVWRCVKAVVLRRRATFLELAWRPSEPLRPMLTQHPN